MWEEEGTECLTGMMLMKMVAKIMMIYRMICGKVTRKCYTSEVEGWEHKAADFRSEANHYLHYRLICRLS